ncbi:MAG: peptidylprolyl isomerase [Oscillospiraceae bacterium]|nr:peptidylprolyl isomerase [Oscillospiraceae bacterium]
MKTKRILSAAAACIIAASLAGCSIRTGTSKFESIIVSVDLKDTDVVASPTGESYAGSDTLDIDYLDFKKEYLYWLKSYKQRYGIETDTDEKYGENCTQQRASIINYMVEERVILNKAHELGLDVLTQEEMDALDADYQENLKTQYEYFGENADYGTLAEGETISEAELLQRGEEEFDKYLADCMLTKEDLLTWQKNALLIEKVQKEVTKDITIERSEAEDVLEDYIQIVKDLYEEDPEKYETGGQYSSFWLPEEARNIKHILIMFDEADGDEISALRGLDENEEADALRDQKLAELEPKANEIMAMLDAGDDFDELIKAYSDDADGSMMYPNGYTVIPGSTTYVDEFVKGAFELENVGDYKLVYSDFGWHIMLYASDAKVSQETLDEFVEYIHETLESNAKSDKYNELMGEWMEAYSYEIDYKALNIPEPVETAEAESTAS